MASLFHAPLKLVVALGLAAISATAVALAPSREIETVRMCAGSAMSRHCSSGPVWTADPSGRIVWLSASVPLDEADRDPLGVFIKAFASSAVYWDGRLIGTNGRPAATVGGEVPGFRDAVVLIPSGLSRPGVHRLEVEMSAMHASMKLAAPLIELRVAPFEEPLEPALHTYLPALLTTGGMFVVLLCLAFLGFRRKGDRSLKYLAGSAFFVTAQLGAESARAFIQLLYPAQISRLELILLCSGGFALLLLAYFLERFEVRRRRLVLATQAAVIVLSVFLLPGFDESTGWTILSGVGSSMAVCAWAMRRRKPGARQLLAMLSVGLLLGLLLSAAFLDRYFYIWSLFLFALLLVQEWEQVSGPEEDAQASRARSQPLWLGSGTTRHLVPPHRIVRLAAADDYTEVFVVGASAVLHPEPLHKLLGCLPPGFVRVHRSHAVNLAHLESLRRGRNSSVMLSDRSVAPVSRRCLPALVKAISAQSICVRPRNSSQ